MSKKIKLDDELYNKAQRHAEIAGYASIDEFVAHILGKEMAKIEEGGDSMEEVEKRLRGLGYIS